MTERAAAMQIMRLNDALIEANEKLASLGESQVEPRTGLPDQYEDSRIDAFIDTN